MKLHFTKVCIYAYEKETKRPDFFVSNTHIEPIKTWETLVVQLECRNDKAKQSRCELKKKEVTSTLHGLPQGLTLAYKI